MALPAHNVCWLYATFTAVACIRDEAIAFSWMLLAAQQHLAMAQRGLGELYEYGSGIAPDITQASHWYRLATLQGDSTARAVRERAERQRTLRRLRDPRGIRHGHAGRQPFPQRCGTRVRQAARTRVEYVLCSTEHIR